LNNDLPSTKIVDGSTEPLKEKKFASVDEVETLKEHNGSGASSIKTSMQHRPESLKIMAMREQGGGSTSDISRKESNKTKGSEFAKVDYSVQFLFLEVLSKTYQFKFPPEEKFNYAWKK